MGGRCATMTMEGGDDVLSLEKPLGDLAEILAGIPSTGQTGVVFISKPRISFGAPIAKAISWDRSMMGIWVGVPHLRKSGCVRSRATLQPGQTVVISWTLKSNALWNFLARWGNTVSSRWVISQDARSHHTVLRAMKTFYTAFSG